MKAQATDRPKVIAYTDGACKKKGLYGGWAAVLISGPHQKIVYDKLNNTTNNRAEIYAVLRTLQQLSEPCDITVYSDSAYVINSINEYVYKWQQNGWKSSKGEDVKNQDLWQQILPYLDIHTVEMQHVKGHNGDEGNETADWFAQTSCSY